MNISQQSLAYSLDKLSALTYGVISSKPGTGLDFSQATSVTGITVTASLPSGSEARIIFSEGADWFTLTTSGARNVIAKTLPDFTTIINSGNTPAQINALTSIPSFAGKIIQVAIALSSDNITNSRPTVTIAAKASNSQALTSFTEFSPVYELGSNATISEIAVDKNTSGDGAVTVTGKAFFEDGGESDWLTEEQLRGVQAESVQLKAVYSVGTVNSGTAKITGCELRYQTGGAYAGGTGRICTITQDWYRAIKSARVNLRHSPLGDSAMKIYAAFRKSPVQVINETLGTSPAERKTYQLKYPNGIRYDSFRLYCDSQEIHSGFDLNCETGRITCSMPEGSILTCSYEYGWDNETWQELSLTSRTSLPDYDMSEYELHTDGDNCSAGALMIEITGQSGRVSEDRLGFATGRAQTFRLKRYCSGNLYVEGGDAEFDKTTWHYKNYFTVDPKNYTLLDNPRLLRVAAKSGAYIRAAYDWSSDPVSIYQLTAVFSD